MARLVGITTVLTRHVTTHEMRVQTLESLYNDDERHHVFYEVWSPQGWTRIAALRRSRMLPAQEHVWVISNGTAWVYAISGTHFLLASSKHKRLARRSISAALLNDSSRRTATAARLPQVLVALVYEYYGGTVRRHQAQATIVQVYVPAIGRKVHACHTLSECRR
jgi:hypothetical protein